MKILVIPRTALDDWNEEHITSLNFCDLTDGQFRKLAYETGWTFDSAEELLAEMNASGAPIPRDNYFRVINEPKEEFEITSVTRTDLAHEGFDAENVSDDRMEELASRMADDYCEQLFHSSLRIIAENMGIPSKAFAEAKERAAKLWDRVKDDATWEPFDHPDDYTTDCNVLLKAEGHSFEGYGQISAGEKELVELTCTTPEGYTIDLIENK